MGKQSPIKVYLNIFIGIKLKWKDERNGKNTVLFEVLFYITKE